MPEEVQRMPREGVSEGTLPSKGTSPDTEPGQPTPRTPPGGTKPPVTVLDYLRGKNPPAKKKPCNKTAIVPSWPQTGGTIDQLASKYGVSPQRLMDLNPDLEAGTTLPGGKEICIG